MAKWGKITFVVVTSFIALAALVCGTELRIWIFKYTQDIHFTLDEHNAYDWGRNARGVGIFNLYEEYQAGHRFSAEVQLDYTPLRLLAAANWYDWTQRNFPRERALIFDYEFVRPMLWANTIAGMLSALFTFLLIRMWVIRMDDARLISSPCTRGEGEGEGSLTRDLESPSPLPSPRVRGEGERRAGPFRGVIQGMIGALLIWFNPALLKNGYVWPQWDVWLLPFALAAIYLACLDGWFCAGLCLAIGASLKGQLLIAVPIMFLWPLFLLRFGALLRIAAGFMLVNMAIALPWMKPSSAAIAWYCLILVGMGLIVPITLRLRWNRFVLATLVAVAMLLAWPWTSTTTMMMRCLPLVAIVLLALMRWLPAKLIPHGCALLVAGVIFLIIPLYDGKTGWYTQGFVYGPNREQTLHGPTANNLPAILQSINRWPNSAHQTVSFLFFDRIEMQSLMAMIYGICLVLCAIAAAMQYKRNDTRFLLAMFLPWLLFFLLLTQIRGRYLVWAAALSALLVAEGVGLMLLGFIITTISLLQMVQNQRMLDRQYLDIQPPTWLPNLQVLEPNMGWVLLLIAAICLYVALSRRRRDLPLSD